MRNRLSLLTGSAVLVAAVLPASSWGLEPSRVHDSAPIPAFARMFRTTCSTCHIAAPKLNVLGEAFRLNGYRMPQTQLLDRADEPLPLGAEPWKDAWPRSIWPGEIPGQVPLALRIQSDVLATRDPVSPASLTFRFPHEVYLLAGGPLGDGVSTFLEMEWSEEHGLEVAQAKVGFQNLIPGLSEGALNMALGVLDQRLFTFTDRQTDRAARQKLSWQDFSLDDVRFSGVPEASVGNQVVMGTGMPAIELNGLLGSRLHWGAGLAQGGGEGVTDSNDRKDPYYRVKMKVGGMDFLGRYPEGGGPVPGAGGQLLDRAIVVEHFGYFGNEATPDAPQGAHRALGWAVQALAGRWDVGVGHVRRTFLRPLGTTEGSLDARSWFAKGEFLLFPWLLGSLKADRLVVEITPGALPAGGSMEPSDRAVLMPGLVALVRQNVRVVVEGELFLAGDRRAVTVNRRPHNLWLRLDLAF
jgi:hypothetical protein